MEYITYEMFGAKGDGQTDDMPAIVRAHAEANRRGLPVKASPGAAYYISPRRATAVIRTSVDWTGASFVIDDRGCDPNGAIFSVPPEHSLLPSLWPNVRPERVTWSQKTKPITLA